MSGEGLEASLGSDSLEIFVLEEQLYLDMGGEWLSLPSDQADLISKDLISPQVLVDQICGWQNQGQTTLDGTTVQHWTLSQEDLEACMSRRGLGGLGKLSDAGGDLYVHAESHYIVQMDLYVEGTELAVGIEGNGENIKEGRIEIHYEITNVNTGFVITLPEEAERNKGLPEDIPIPDDATELSQMTDLITFTSEQSVQEIADFYQLEMPDNGWAEQSVQKTGDSFLMDYTKEDRKASLIINTDDSGQTSVVISLENTQE
jgi:hypothetical protein